MWRSGRVRRALRWGLVAPTVLLLLSGGTRAAAVEEVWRLDVKTTEIVRKRPEGDHRVTELQPHYRIQFEADERFVFIIPEEFMGRGREGVFSDGSTPFLFREADDEPWIPLWVANRVLAYRAALLAAEDYFAEAARRAGLTLRFWSDDPIEVVIGESRPGTSADAAFWKNRIVLKPTSWQDPHTIAVHEYFHFVQDAVWYDGDEEDFWERYLRGSSDPFHLFLDEMSAEWATDEAMRILGVGGRLSENLDASNYYLEEQGSYFLGRNREPFFETDEYETNLFIKYLAEQIAGKKDESAAPEILTLLARIFERGGANRENFFQVVSEMAPPGDFDAATSEGRWSRFFRAFSAGNVVQRGASLEDPKAPAGYWDDAFASLGLSYKIQEEDFRDEEASLHSERIYHEAARDDTERRERLEALMGQDELVEALSYRVHPLALSRSRQGAAPRPVYFLARGIPGTEVFLLGQRFPYFHTYRDRRQARFSWHPDFDFPQDGGEGERRAYYEYPGFDPGMGSEFLWLGLVNSGTELKSKVVAWAYQASPRIIPRNFKPAFGTETVRLVGGSAYQRFNPNEGFYNGDSFELEIWTTGPLHRKGADPNRLAAEDVAARLRVLHEDGREIPLDSGGDGPIRIRASRPPNEFQHYWIYCLSGKFAEDHAVTGRGRFEIRITSPLNMGGDDVEVDDSYAFSLRARRPLLERLKVASDDSTLLYDSEKGIRRVPVPRDGRYELDLEANFSLPMLERSVEITAGRKPPYDSYRVGRVDCRDDDRVCSGRLTVPGGDVPAAGLVLRFAIGGDGNQGESVWIKGSLDADPLEPGPQPDTRHFVVLGVEEMYRLSQSSRSTQESRVGDLVKKGELGPIDFEIDFLPEGVDSEGRRNVYVGGFEGVVRSGRILLENVKKAIVAIEREYQEISDDPEEHAERLIESLERRRDGFQASLDGRGPPLPPGREEEIRRFQRETVARLDAQIEALEERDKEKLGAEIAENRRLALGRQRSRLAFLEARYLPTIEAARRVMGGFKKFHYRAELAGPSPVSFDGLRVEWSTRGGPYPEEWEKHEGRPGALSFEQGRLSAAGWSAARMEEFSPNGPSHYPEVLVWDFWPSDLEKVQVLLDLMGHYPESFAKAPEDGVSEWIEKSPEESQADAYAELLADDTDRHLIELCRRMWRFFPKSEWPQAEMQDYVGDLNEERKSCPRLPLVNGTRLIQLQAPGKLSGLPLDVEGYSLKLVYDHDYERLPLAPRLGVHAPEIIDRPGLRDVAVETYYEKGMTRRRDVRFDSQFDWLGLVPPPDLVYGVPIPHQERFSVGYLNNREARQSWSIVESSSPQAVDPERGDAILLLIQTKENVAHGTVRGRRDWMRTGFLDHTASFVWDTHFRLERVGATPTARDPAEALPKWVEPGEEGRRPLRPKPPPRPVKKRESEPPRQAWARAYDPDTGITSDSRRNPDGSVTVTRTDRDGTVLSTERREPRRGQLPSASSTDPRSGVTTRAERTASGDTRIRRSDRDGNLLSERIVAR